MEAPEPRPPLDELVTHAGFLRALARGLLADEHLAEDVVQQAFLRALARPPAERGFLRAWLARIVRNAAANTVRGEGRRARRERAASRDEAQAAHERAELELALQREVADAVAALHEPYRTVVHLRYFRGQAPARIAEELGVPFKTVESRLTRAHALLRRRLDRAWREQGERARAIYLALAPAGSGWTVLGGMLMTKQTVLVVLGGASLLGLFFTWRALEPVTRERVEAPATSEVEGAPPGESLVTTGEEAAEREESPDLAARVAPEPSPAPPDPQAEVELERALERLGTVLDRSLEGRLDPGAILDAALLVAEHEAGDPLAEMDPARALVLPIEGLPPGAEAELLVGKPGTEKVLSLRIRLQRDEPFVFEGYGRQGASVHIATRTNAAGELLSFSIITDVEPSDDGAIGAGRYTNGTGLHTRLDAPSEWKLETHGDEVSLLPDGKTFQIVYVEPPQVLDGGPWPRVEDMRRLSQRLLAMHAAVKERAGR